MTCIVLTRNPNSGEVLAITESNDGQTIAEWPSTEAALAFAPEQVLVEAWGGWVVDLDNLEVIEV